MRRKDSKTSDAAQGGGHPALVVSLDLVKHSTRSPEEIDSIQHVVLTVLKSALNRFDAGATVLNYTGDGYICAILDQASADGVDFLRSLAASLRRELGRYEQSFRMGADFGFVRLKHNDLTNRPEHFAQPGIRAARLQAACDPDAVLVTREVRDLYVPIVGDCFQKDERVVEIKAHKIAAVGLNIDDAADAHYAPLTSFLLTAGADIRARFGEGKSLLWVEDDDPIRKMFDKLFQRLGFEVTSVVHGEDALRHFRARPFDVVVTDIMMPGMGGVRLISQLRLLQPAQAIVIASAVPASELVRQGVPADIPMIAKPFHMPAYFATMYALVREPGLRQLRRWFPDAGFTLTYLGETAACLQSFLAEHSGDNAVDGLLRHKAKEHVHSYVSSLDTGKPAAEESKTLFARVQRLIGLGARIKRAEAVGPVRYLEAVAADVAGDHPNMSFDVRASSSADDVLAQPELSAALVLCAIELIDNSCDATRGNGTVSVTFDVRQSEGTVRMTVRNSGPRVPARLETRIFDEGITTKGAGRGLGLSLVNRLVESMGGQVRLQQAADVAFSVTLPIVR